ncbi:MAG: Ig-like domain-containing protein, partial [Candidatus Stygibacter australis]|nr:Ig-like domain-containing protein [Candidatus Stygibacter australis]
MKHLRLAIVILFLFTMSYLIAEPDWSPVIYTDTGSTFYGDVTIDGVAAGPDDLFGIFVGDECRAIANPGIGGHVYGLTVQCQTGTTETLSFRIWDASNDVICDGEETHEVTHNEGNIMFNVNAITPEILDSEITLGSAAGNQVTDFTVELSSYQGIAIDWNINKIEFEVHFTNSLLALTNYNTTDMLASGNTVSISGTSSPVTVTINSGSTISGVAPIIGLTFTPQGTGGTSALDIQNFTYTDTGASEYSITNLIDGEAVITYENFLPYVVLEIPDQYEAEDFVAYDLNLNDYFSDDNNDILSYSAVFDSTEITISILNSILTFSPINYWNGTSVVSITADDQYRATVSDTFNVIISAVNNAPVIALPASFSFAEDQTSIVDFTGYISDVDGDTPILSVSDNVNVTVNIVGYNVTFGAAADWNGSETIIFTVVDIEVRATASDTVEIIVTPVNDEPVITNYSPTNLNVNIPVDSLQLFSIIVLDIDTDMDSLVYTWYVDGDEQLEQSNNFSYAFPSNGSYTVTGSVFDGEYTAENTWNVFAYVGSATLEGSQISILPIEIHNGPDFSFEVLTSYIDDLWDVTSFSFGLSFDSTLVEYSAIDTGVVSAGGIFSVTDSGDSIYVSYSGGDVIGAGAITELTFNTLVPGTTVLTITNFLYNATGITDITNGNLTVLNDAPVSLGIENFNKNEDFLDFSFDLDDHFNDQNGDILSYSVVFDSTEIGITLNDVNGELTISSILYWYGTSIVTVTATDEYAAFVQEEFSVIVSSVNNLPIIVNPIGNFTEVEDFETFTVELESVFFDVEDNDLDYQENLVSGQ